jgi:hypothetical protein
VLRWSRGGYNRQSSNVYMYSQESQPLPRTRRYPRRRCWSTGRRRSAPWLLVSGPVAGVERLRADREVSFPCSVDELDRNPDTSMTLARARAMDAGPRALSRFPQLPAAAAASAAAAVGRRRRRRRRWTPPELSPHALSRSPASVSRFPSRGAARARPRERSAR